MLIVVNGQALRAGVLQWRWMRSEEVSSTPVEAKQDDLLGAEMARDLDRKCARVGAR